MEEIRDKKQEYKKKFTVFFIIQCILIALSVILYILRDTNIGNFSMVKLFIMFLASTILIGVFIGGYIINGLFMYNIIKINFVRNINYKLLMTILFIMMIVGSGVFFTQLCLVGGQLTNLTWGSFTLGLICFIIFCITSIIGIFTIIYEIKPKL